MEQENLTTNTPVSTPVSEGEGIMRGNVSMFFIRTLFAPETGHLREEGVKALCTSLYLLCFIFSAVVTFISADILPHMTIFLRIASISIVWFGTYHATALLSRIWD